MVPRLAARAAGMGERIVPWHTLAVPHHFCRGNAPSCKDRASKLGRGHPYERRAIWRHLTRACCWRGRAGFAGGPVVRFGSAAAGCLARGTAAEAQVVIRTRLDHCGWSTLCSCFGGGRRVELLVPCGRRSSGPELPSGGAARPASTMTHPTLALGSPAQKFRVPVRWVPLAGGPLGATFQVRRLYNPRLLLPARAGSGRRW